MNESDRAEDVEQKIKPIQVLQPKAEDLLVFRQRDMTVDFRRNVEQVCEWYGCKAMVLEHETGIELRSRRPAIIAASVQRPGHYVGEWPRSALDEVEEALKPEKPNG